MAFGILGQTKPASTVLTDCYTVGAGLQASISSIVCCNISNSIEKMRIKVVKSGEPENDKQWLYYDVEIPNNDTFVATIGVTLSAGDKIKVYSENGYLSFNVFGFES